MNLQVKARERDKYTWHGVRPENKPAEKRNYTSRGYGGRGQSSCILGVK